MNTATPLRFQAAREAAAAPTPVPAAPDHAPDYAAQLRRQLPPPHAALRACVIIPAKNEAAALPATLAALAAQTDLAGQPLPPGTFEVIVLANNCTDGTAAAVRRFAGQRPGLALHVATLCLAASDAHVGRARRLLMDEACQRLLGLGRFNGLIASTDADTRVAPDWLAATRAEIAAGADAVGGRILTDAAPSGRCPVRRTQLRDAAYHLLCARLEARLDPQAADPWPRHHQHFGASLALTARVYRRVGGLPVRRYLEDEALCQQLRRHDLRLRHSPRVVVHTSPRRCGRVEVGLSWQLREWAAQTAENLEPQVPCPRHLAALWQARRRLRTWWAHAVPFGAPGQGVAAALGLAGKPLARQVLGSRTFGRLWEWVEQARAAAGVAVPQVPLSEALAWLRAQTTGAE
ncbi:glycosyltransferase [Hymenobacter caeli]|uniref:Glycosyltransferase 2-like domain-containing protein n=1 Tax=Hymenobacter caeli TaxID=2735894 RepID=A0ABX2FTN9_9BACT|nr:glycosyltransferase [Hymenobacter caeli]NRT20560.1 hypothetical protein [Hymenobacter caeli]